MSFWRCCSPCPGLGQLLIWGIMTVLHCWISALGLEGTTDPRASPGPSACACCLRGHCWLALCALVLSGASKSTPLQNSDNLFLLEWEKTSDHVLGALP